ncbi:mRNA triphosphatase CET1 [Tilletiaria anomala UBC 951]|uniref:mRNA-capping enzyme subunit beta n=1 Tax=Tilletiaria anomala (strain ATCC 24038 / CBS 436.72 / UBC 951) TaxID=1037660 RepID=A0A066WGW9_TILAU|nr:mRNA triphosphatase CET1 [Tilletiaria anomala UBC 951]KDN53056.1 mRNA triphosphatase CET1 [Tilletiaria anomala UBC 951]
MPWPKPPLERSIFNVDPLDEFSVTIADWIWSHVQGLQNIEIEAKIGTLIDTSTNHRLRLPVLCETIVDMPGVRFESDMSAKQHAHFNAKLNEVVERTSSQSYKGDKVRYRRSMEADAFYHIPGSKERIRVTKNEETMKITNAIVKKRIANMEVYSPRSLFDFRISINTEEPVEPPDAEPAYIRNKNRVSYAHQCFQVDLTQVQTPENPYRQMHELEVEMLDVGSFLSLGEEARRQGESQKWTPFEDRVLILLNNVRMLIRNACPP